MVIMISVIWLLHSGYNKGMTVVLPHGGIG